MWEFVRDRWDLVLYNGYQHGLLVFYAVLIATVIAVVLAVIVTQVPKLEPVANVLSAIGLTIPSFALVGLLLPLTKIGNGTALVAVTFYAILPILRNAVVGLREVDKTLLESAKGMGMTEFGAMTRVRIPLAWPVIHAGVRTSVQMSMGVAAIAAYTLGPGFGAWIFLGIQQAGGENAINYALVATIGIVVVALIADFLMLLLGRLTISKGIRA